MRKRQDIILNAGGVIGICGKKARGGGKKKYYITMQYHIYAYKAAPSLP